MSGKILISACLLGQNVRYDGGNATIAHPLILKLKEENRLIPICPEVAAGASSPRPSSEIVGKGGGKAVLEGTAKVINRKGEDITALYSNGAKIALNTALKNDVKIAILKDGSPSCGSRKIYDGTFSGNKIDGKGITATLLSASGVMIFSEREIDEVTVALIS